MGNSGKSNTTNEPNLKGKLTEKLKQMFGYPFKWDGYGFVAELDEVERDRVTWIGFVVL